jgi:hypothetical protein
MRNILDGTMNNVITNKRVVARVPVWRMVDRTGVPILVID